jgi:TPR repeat protein
MYANGQGVPQDDFEAVKWYRLAAEQGSSRPRTGSAACMPTVKASPWEYVAGVHVGELSPSSSVRPNGADQQWGKDSLK